MSGANPGFIRGLRVCAAMLRGIDDGGLLDPSYRGEPQANAVRREIVRLLKPGREAELEGFTAALTDVLAWSRDYGSYEGALDEHADRLEQPLRQRLVVDNTVRS